MSRGTSESMDMHAPVLHARSLGLSRGERLLFRDLSFRVEAGGLLLLRGPNGSGKSSLLRILAGLLPPTAGDVEWDGDKPRIRYIGHQDGLKTPLTVRENLAFLSAIENAPCERNIEALHLSGLLDLPVRDLSAGQKRRTAMTRLVAGDGSLWVLDEPTTALDEHARNWLWDTVARHRAQGGMVVAAVHDPDTPKDADLLTLGAPR